MKSSKTIGIFHYQLGLTDGVSLEVDKWKTVLEKMGHRVLLCAGRLGNQDGILLPELYHHRPEIELVNQNILGQRDDLTSDALQKRINDQTGILENALRDIIISDEIDILLVNNIWSVAMNIPAAVALEKVRQALGIRAIAHHHDFYWERKLNPKLGSPEINNIHEGFLPPKDPNIDHIVINSIAQLSLEKFKGLSSKIIPNVFDFDGPDWVVDDYNQDLRQAIGLDAGDICVLQATRIIPRKGIELAIDAVKALNEPGRRAILQARGLYDGRAFKEKNKIVLVLAGYDRDDPTGVYLQKLKTKAKDLGVDLRHIDSIIGPERCTDAGSKTYALWDTYAVADFVTYPSLWEGWGNQLLEAFRAKLPILMFEYPVYLQDIKDRGFDVISLGSQITGRDQRDLVQVPDAIIQQAADHFVTYLTSRSAREEMVNKNFNIAESHYSYKVLESQLNELL
ncbi:MAG: glycosyltransferase family 4 protein [Brevefilum sp.]|nr:glycosyltransferase family 4 protein [Brevefilum sp.]